LEIVYAPYFEEESIKAGCRSSEIAAGRRTAELYADAATTLQVDTQLIKATVNRGPFRPWIRLKAPASNVRVIVERAGDTLVVHAVLPRWAETYEEVVDLWKQYRTRI
jgi:hypothetical protein